LKHRVTQKEILREKNPVNVGILEKISSDSVQLRNK